MSSKNIMVVYGTRPEGIKLAPVVAALREHDALSATTVVTGQHREMLDQVNEIFDIVPDVDLDLFAPGQSLTALTARILSRLEPVLARSAPDAVVVQSDTTTVAAAGLAAFHQRIPVVHLEAGLRSGSIHSPFPEEANRRLTSQIASLHLAPTPTAMANLLREGVPIESIAVTGNTVIDALLHARARCVTPSDPRIRGAVAEHRPIILVTTHRRENWGDACVALGRALRRLAAMYPDHLIVLPAHRNPVVRQALLPQVEGVDTIVVSEPLAYGEFIRVMDASRIVLTDSGGIQEEAPSLGKPVLVMRDNTERPEAVATGTVRLIGTQEERIVSEVSALIDSPVVYEDMTRAVNPYGDGMAARRTVAAIAELLGVGVRLPDFSAPRTPPLPHDGPPGGPAMRRPAAARAPEPADALLGPPGTGRW